jgi:hypothetical protein
MTDNKDLNKIIEITDAAIELERDRIIQIIEEEFDRSEKLVDTAKFRHRILERIKE